MFCMTSFWTKKKQKMLYIDETHYQKHFIQKTIFSSMFFLKKYFSTIFGIFFRWILLGETKRKSEIIFDKFENKRNVIWKIDSFFFYDVFLQKKKINDFSNIDILFGGSNPFKEIRNTYTTSSKMSVVNYTHKSGK